MKILVVNGSPKGEGSITLQTVRYLEKRYPQHGFDVLHVGQRIKSLEKDFTPALRALEAAELVLFCYPVYTFLAPAQLHRFIELLYAHRESVSGLMASQITTSKHFYDVTAHRYIEDNCHTLGMRVVSGLSADMEDLTCPRGQKEAEAFFERLIFEAENGLFERDARPAAAYKPVPATPAQIFPDNKEGSVVIVADLAPGDRQLSAMIDRLRAKLPQRSSVINLREFPFGGGCLGCFHCAGDGTCVYKDGFDRFLRERIQTAQATVYAFSIREHSMGALMKLYDDRQFCNGHRTVTMGMPVAYLVSGAYSAETNLQTVVSARAQVGGNPLCGVATDESDTDAQIDRLAAKLDYAIRSGYTQPQNFYGVGGMKIFRDLIWQMRGMMRADHKFYKAHGQYDFPQRHWLKALAMYLVGFMNTPKMRRKLGGKMTEGMLMPYQKVLRSVTPKK